MHGLYQKMMKKKVVKIKGRDITIYDQPNYRSGRKRKREEVQVIRPDHIVPAELANLGKGKKIPDSYIWLPNERTRFREYVRDASRNGLRRNNRND